MIFYKNLIKGKKSQGKNLVYDVFQDFVDTSKAESKQEVKKVSTTYNFDISNGELKTGYGFKKLQMPTSTQNLDAQEELALDGNEVYAVWSFKWYDTTAKENKYYVMYYNDLNHIGFSNLFNTRPLPLFAATSFTQTPVGSNTRYKNDDAMVFSSNISGLYLVTGSIMRMYPNAPELVSVCAQYDKYFAITSGARGKLVYSNDKDITAWTSSTMQEISFDDDRGKLNKVISFGDYVYVFRDFGISKISMYSTKSDFDISGLYQCDSYIYPQTIASSGDRVYFLEGSGIFSFNGSSASKINLDCDEMLNKTDKRNASAVCFEGKYYLACRYDFNDGETVGCENEEGYINNVLFVLDLVSKKVNLVRGVDIKQLCVLNNPYKSKVIACFNGENIAYIGELTKDGIVFGENTEKVWSSVKSDLGYPDKIKKAEYLTIKTLQDCDVVVSTEKDEKVYKLEGNENIQRLNLNLIGKEFKIFFKSSTQKANISNVKLGYSV